jgi:hypothetical protein
MKHWLLLVCLAGFFGELLAGVPALWYPEDGTWRDPDAPGRNYKIEVQDDVLILNVFGYRNTGSAVWYQAAGTGSLLASGYVEFSATLSEYENGQCIGCPYTKPTLKGANGGDITITFKSPSMASVRWGSEAFDIERSDVVVGSGAEANLGAWTAVYQIVGSFSEIFEMTSVSQDSNSAGSTGIALGLANYGDKVGWECYEGIPDSSLNNKCLIVILNADTDEVEDVFRVLPAINQARGVWVSQSTGKEYPVWMNRIAGKKDLLNNVAATSADIQAVSVDEDRQRPAVPDEKKSSRSEISVQSHNAYEAQIGSIRSALINNNR